MVDSTRLDEYFAAGLLHDIGKIPLNNILSEEYLQAMGLADRERIPLYMAEKRVLNLDHAETGAMIAEVWKLDKPLSDAISLHHACDSYNGSNKELVFTVAVADYYANRERIGFSGSVHPDKVPPEMFDFLGIEKAWLEEIDDLVNKEIEKASIFLKLKTGA